jgi:transcriptional regulator with XRE-family HTH domain
MTFGKRLKNARKEKGLTQKELAALIHVKHNSISDWENDKNKPDIATVELLCGVLAITPSYIMGVKESDRPVLTADDAILIKKYHLLSDENKKMVTNLIDAMIKMQDDIAL